MLAKARFQFDLLNLDLLNLDLLINLDTLKLSLFRTVAVT